MAGPLGPADLLPGYRNGAVSVPSPLNPMLPFFSLLPSFPSRSSPSLILLCSLQPRPKTQPQLKPTATIIPISTSLFLVSIPHNKKKKTFVSFHSEIHLQNLKEKKLNVTLWGNLANEFNEITVKSSPKPVMAMTVKQYLGKPDVGSSSSTMYFFNPEIPEVHEYKRRFEDFPQHLEFILACETKPLHPDEQKNVNRKKNSELLIIDSNMNKNVSFTCKASIVNFDLSQGWWYRLHCVLQDDTRALNVTIFGRIAQALIKKSRWTLTMEDRHTDQQTLPPIIDELKGLTRIFQLYFGPKGITTKKPDFVVSKFFYNDSHSPITISKHDQPKTLSAPNIPSVYEPLKEIAIYKSDSEIKKQLFQPSHVKQEQISQSKMEDLTDSFLSTSPEEGAKRKQMR
ncbi:hypothetical protein DITRI_Ditri17bG0054000 [Diplodiscus trichospermus]